MQIDLYCWNYNFAGEDCDQYDYTDALPVVLIQSMRLFRRYAYKFLMLFGVGCPTCCSTTATSFFFFSAERSASRPRSIVCVGAASPTDGQRSCAPFPPRSTRSNA